MIEGWGFNPPPNWPKPPGSWMPPAGWLPDPGWGPVPPGWQLWIPDGRAQRKRGRSAVGLAAVLAAVVLAVVVPRSDGPGSGDPLAGGVANLSLPLPALIATEAPPTPTGSPTPAPHSAVAVTRTPVIRAYPTCASLNRAYPNGVGLPTAVDRTTGTPVTAFGRSATIYRANLGHDLDVDGIACEPGQPGGPS